MPKLYYLLYRSGNIGFKNLIKKSKPVKLVAEDLGKKS